jgi:hypothetical protein
MDDAEELAVLREYAAKTDGGWVCLGDFYIGRCGNDWIARRINLSSGGERGVSYNDDSVLARYLPLGPCIIAASAKLQAERDAKDAPRLREERDKFKAALEEIRDSHASRAIICSAHGIAVEALKESP